MSGALSTSTLRTIYSGKTVWLSGHTGFKGAWLAVWLTHLGAKVHGFSLAPPTTPSLFEQLGLKDRLNHEHGDVRDPGAVRHSILTAQPDFLFHLAAQSIVRTSYEQPVDTYTTNVIGTVNVLEALRSLGRPCAAVFVTTDKCYENRESVYAYREEDPLGGVDPYSSSKAAAELAIAAWRRSFFKDGSIHVASARAGNVIGGGDWARDRIVPDCIRALQRGQPIQVRNKSATRAWQHVLDPLSGYLWLAAVLHQPALRSFDASAFASAFNFGPGVDGNRTVAELVTELLKHWPGQWEDRSEPDAPHEAQLLDLATDKACHLLGWKATWPFEKAVEATVRWYESAQRLRNEPEPLLDATMKQIGEFEADAAGTGAVWAQGPGC